MTGFGAAAGEVDHARVAVEIRTVNHRHHSPNLKLPPALSAMEPEIRERLRRRIARGHVTLTARVDSVAAEATIDEQRFAAYVDRLRDLQLRHTLPGPIDVAAVLRLPGVVGAGSEETLPAEPVLALVEQAVDALTSMRQREGERLVEVLRERLREVSSRIDRIAARAPQRIEHERDRLQQNVKELAGGVDVDPARLAQEIAILSDKLDVSEEIDRFRAHVAAFDETLARTDGEPVGRRLAFLLQEMLRETNTTGSKARDAEMLHDVVGVKEELERIAEQVENIE